MTDKKQALQKTKRYLQQQESKTKQLLLDYEDYDSLYDPLLSLHLTIIETLEEIEIQLLQL